MKDIAELLTLGESALRIIGKEVDDAEVFVSRDSSRTLGIENNKIKAVTGGGETGIALRILMNGKMGFSYATDIRAIPDALKFAKQVAAISPEKPFEFPHSEQYYTIPDLLDQRVLDLTPEYGKELVMQMIESALDVHDNINVTGGGISYGEGEVVIMNTKGLEVSEHVSGVGASIHTVFNGMSPSSGYEFDSSHTFLNDFENIGRKAAELAVKGQNKIKVETKQVPVVFKPEAISSLFEFILIPALYGIRAEKGESVFSNRLNEEIMHPNLSIVDDPTMPDGENAMKMDDEGVPSRCHELVKRGILKDYLYTIGTGAEFGHASTGSGIRGSGQDYTAPISTSGRNIIVQGDTTDEETLISEIDDGILVHDLMGAHTSNPASGDFSVTGSIIFRIVKGEITNPVSQAMLSGNLPDYLHKVTALGNNYKRLSGGLSPVGFYLPSVRIDSVSMTGEL